VEGERAGKAALVGCEMGGAREELWEGRGGSWWWVGWFVVSGYERWCGWVGWFVVSGCESWCKWVGWFVVSGYESWCRWLG